MQIARIPVHRIPSQYFHFRPDSSPHIKRRTPSQPQGSYMHLKEFVGPSCTQMPGFPRHHDNKIMRHPYLGSLRDTFQSFRFLSDEKWHKWMSSNRLRWNEHAPGPWQPEWNSSCFRDTHFSNTNRNFCISISVVMLFARSNHRRLMHSAPSLWVEHCRRILCIRPSTLRPRAHYFDRWFSICPLRKSNWTPGKGDPRVSTVQFLDARRIATPENYSIPLFGNNFGWTNETYPQCQFQILRSPNVQTFIVWTDFIEKLSVDCKCTADHRWWAEWFSFIGTWFIEFLKWQWIPVQLRLAYKTSFS